MGYLMFVKLAASYQTWRSALGQWSPRRWWVALASGIAVAALIALPTAVIPNPIFGRSIEVTWWSYPTVILSGIIGGLIIASYIRESDPESDHNYQEENEPEELELSGKDPALRWGTIGGFVSFFAVGCPVCNKLVLIALGTTGAVSWFAPIQPFLALASIIFMLWALHMRLKNQDSCSFIAA